MKNVLMVNRKIGESKWFEVRNDGLYYIGYKRDDGTFCPGIKVFRDEAEAISHGWEIDYIKIIFDMKQAPKELRLV